MKERIRKTIIPITIYLIIQITIISTIITIEHNDTSEYYSTIIWLLKNKGTTMTRFHSLIYPITISTILYPIKQLNEIIILQSARIINVIINILTAYQTTKLAKKQYWNTITWTTLLNPITIIYGNLLFPISLATLLIITGIIKIKQNKNISAGIILTIAGMTRYSFIPIIIIMIIHKIYNGTKKENTKLITTMTITLLITGIIDTIMYKTPYYSLIMFYGYNLIIGKTLVKRTITYYAKTIILQIPTIIYLTKTKTKDWRKTENLLLLGIIIHSLFPNKQWHYLYYTIPIISIIIAKSIKRTSEKAKILKNTIIILITLAITLNTITPLNNGHTEQVLKEIQKIPEDTDMIVTGNMEGLKIAPFINKNISVQRMYDYKLAGTNTITQEEHQIKLGCGGNIITKMRCLNIKIQIERNTPKEKPKNPYYLGTCNGGRICSHKI